jgi:hypothetical protein
LFTSNLYTLLLYFHCFSTVLTLHPQPAEERGEVVEAVKQKTKETITKTKSKQTRATTFSQN